MFFKAAALLLLVTVCFTACNAPDTQPSDHTPANLTRPFHDGIFLFAPSYFEECRDIWFRYGEGRQYFGEFDGSFYEAADFHSHTTAFIDLINSLAPVFVDAATTTTADNDIPFEGITRDNYLYLLQINDYFFRMLVHQTEEFGYLYFLIWEWEIHADELGYDTHWMIRDDLHHHSLYRITLDELERIIEFAEGLEKMERIWTATPAQ